MRLTGKRILLISPQPWEGLHMSKHHLAQALAARGNTVVFLDPPSAGVKGVPWRMEGAVRVATYRHWARGINRLPKAVHMWYYGRLLRSVAAATGGPFDILWCFDTSRLQWFPAGMGWPLLHLADIDILHQGHGLVSGARLVLTVSEEIRDRVQALGPKAPVHVLGHALHEGWLARERKAGPSPRVPRTVAYAGQMRWDYVDWDAILAMAMAHGTLAFHFYGPFREDHPHRAFARVRALPNVVFHGLVPKDRLIPALVEADILLLCYRKDLPPDQVSNSHKLLEYLATGNVVVASHIPRFAEHNSLLRMAGPDEDPAAVFAATVEVFDELSEPALRAARRSFAERHTWAQALDRVEHWMTDERS